MSEFKVRYPVNLKYKKKKDGRAYTSYDTFNAEGKRKPKFKYFGKYGTPESKQKFSDFVQAIQSQKPIENNGLYHYIVGEAVRDWLAFESVYGWTQTVAGFFTPYATMDASKFTGEHFREIVEAICQEAVKTQSWNITTVRKIIASCRDLIKYGEVRRIFPRGLVSEVGMSQYNRIVKRYRDRIRDPREMEMPGDFEIEKVCQATNPVLRTMIIIANQTGMRPQELAKLNTQELNTATWEYVPKKHKTAGKGHTRSVFLNEICIEALEQLQDIRPDAGNDYYFTVREARAFNEWEKHQQKFTPEMLKLLAGTQSNAKVAKKLGVERFTVRNWRTQTKEHEKTLHSIWKNMKIRGSELFSRNKFYRHLERACEKAGVKDFCPYSFRHKVGQEVRDQHGIEAASALLGHKQLNTTEIYAKKAAVLAQNIAELRALSANTTDE